MKKIESHLVPKLEKPVRLSDYTVGIFNAIPTKKGMKKAITNRLVKVNDDIGRTGRYIHGGEIITLFEAKKPSLRSIARIKLDVLHEDDHLAIIHKPAGLIVSGNKHRTVENALPHNLKESSEVDVLRAPQPIHRLDFPTSGVLLIGKTRSSVIALNSLFEHKKIDKVYYAITTGEMDAEGSVETDIKGKSALTKYTVIHTQASDKYNNFNFVKVEPTTGRRHQIRIHLSEIGHPILGDKKYMGSAKNMMGKGLFLHAYSLSFIHPNTGETITIKQSLPGKFSSLFPQISSELTE